MTLVLHGYWRSGTTYRTRIALNLKGLKYDTAPVNLVEGDAEVRRLPARSIRRAWSRRWRPAAWC